MKSESRKGDGNTEPTFRARGAAAAKWIPQNTGEMAPRTALTVWGDHAPHAFLPQRRQRVGHHLPGDVNCLVNTSARENQD